MFIPMFTAASLLFFPLSPPLASLNSLAIHRMQKYKRLTNRVRVQNPEIDLSNQSDGTGKVRANHSQLTGLDLDQFTKGPTESRFGSLILAIIQRKGICM